ncbi:MAG TPA: NUDIX domain-containing protein [Verrucomicrobiae bacterium]|nr:NUDIX domain-containing protein [Verrucomicrobiae bacterium]
MAQCAFAIVKRDDKVLLVQIALPFRHAHSWNFPGGVIEDGEAIEAGLVREVFEESRIHCRINRYVILLPSPLQVMKFLFMMPPLLPASYNHKKKRF